jgi:hypothetical protein
VIVTAHASAMNAAAAMDSMDSSAVGSTLPAADTGVGVYQLGGASSLASAHSVEGTGMRESYRASRVVLQ